MSEAIDPKVVGHVCSVQVGTIAPLGPDLVPSGFVKRPIAGVVSVAALGLDGDAQADLSVHGGPDKAVYGYGAAAYDAWRREFPEHADRFQPGSLGENLTLDGMDESSVCIGDVVKIGGTVLQVTQPRQPCFKFALRFGDNRMPQAMAKNGLCGWYYRVTEPGTLAAGDRVVLEERPNPAWTIARFYRMITRHTGTAADMAELAVMEGLAHQWRAQAAASVAGSQRK